jgi:hypothetical protein
MRGIPRAATGPVRRVVVVTSIGVAETHWLPRSAMGAPLVLPPAFASLAPVLDHVLYMPGLGWSASPLENHSSPQTLTGRTADTAYQPTTLSIDQFIAAQLAPSTKSPSLLLGVNEALDESHHWKAGARLTPIINPLDAFQQAFGVSAAPAAASGSAALPRQAILNLVASQIKQVQGSLGAQGKARLDQHLSSLEQLQKNLSGTAAAAGCAPGAAPSLGGLEPGNNAAAAAVSASMNGIVANVLSCDISRIVGMQFGKSNTAFCQYTPALGIEEHSAVHNPGNPQFAAQLLQCEAFIGSWVATLATTLKATPDPLNAGTSLLDNTLIAWIRDMGDGPNHLQYALPYALVGGTSYLKSTTGGRLQIYNGLNASATVGMSHQRLLLNLADFMGVTNFAGFGNFTGLGAPGPLAEIKA